MIDAPFYTARDVGCSYCGAVAGQPCVRRDGSPAVNHHSHRLSYAKQVSERVAEDRHVRFRARRRGGAPRVPQPCGTRSAAVRHKRNGEDLDARCEQALRDWERERSAARRSLVQR